jgi:hypothetical protein
MALGDYRIVPGLVTEEIGQEILVCDTDLAVVHRVSGPAADVLRQVLASGGAPVALESDDITSGLVAAGVLVAADAPGDLVSRRSFVGAAAAVGAMGIVTLALPRAAAASSNIDPNNSLPPEPDPLINASLTQNQYPASAGEFTTGTAGENIQVRWTDIPGEKSFFFRVLIEPAFGQGTFATVEATNIPSGSSYTNFFVPGFEVENVARVRFFTIGLISNVTGEARIAERLS